MRQTHFISFITVNYNGVAETLALIDSIYSCFFSHADELKGLEFEIVVVDNKSDRDELHIIKNRYPEVIAIQSPHNFGFAAGNNLGFAKSVGDYVFFINNDVQLRDDSVKYLVERLQSSQSTAGASPKILSSKNGKTIQFAGFTKLSKITMRNKIIGLDEVDIGQYDQPGRTPYIHGAAVIVKREVINKVGGWPEDFFLYYEELDWSTKITNAGYELWYEPKCTVYHSGSASIGVNSPVQVFYMTRNRMLYAVKNFHRFAACLSVIYQWFIAVPKQCFKFIIKRKFNLVAVSLRACYNFRRGGKINL